MQQWTNTQWAQEEVLEMMPTLPLGSNATSVMLSVIRTSHQVFIYLLFTAGTKSLSIHLLPTRSIASRVCYIDSAFDFSSPIDDEFDDDAGGNVVTTPTSTSIPG